MTLKNKANINLNPKQMEAVNAVEDKVLIVAPAGSGKTSTLIGAIQKYKEENEDDVVVAITFTNKATDELVHRLGPLKSVYPSTIHSWAYQELSRLSQAIQLEDPNSSFKIKLLQDDRIKEILTEMLKKKKYFYVKVDILFSYIMGNYNMDISDSLRQIFQVVKAEYVNYKEIHGLYDFTDLPKYLLDKLNDYDKDITGIDALFVDEFQDVDDIQLELFERVQAKKKFYIGDPQQCQPAGTKIRMSDGSQKNIEDIEIGDTVVSYFKSESYISGCQRSQGFKVLEKSERDFVGDYLISVESENGKISKYTPNHRTFAAIRSDNEYNHLVYLMEDLKGRFRIGTSQFYANYNGQDMSTFRHKVNSEGYVNAWIIKVCKTDKEARLYENKYSYQFQIPQLTFQTKKSNYTEEEIDFVYRDLDTRENAKKLLNYLLLDIRYPFLSKNDGLDFRRDAFREFYAINLIPEVMSILTHDATQPATRSKNRVPSKLIRVEKEWIYNPIKVYSLKIETHETYVADDIVTHNSIYIFRGATEDVMKKLHGFKMYNLDINYRSNQEIIDFASTYQQTALSSPITFTGQLESYRSSILCDKGNGGNVYVLARTGSAYKINEFIKYRGDKVVEDFLKLEPMILCRKNKEVKAIKELGWEKVQTIHQAKGLEYPAVIVTDFEIRDVEDINISYVAMTRAESNLLAANYTAFMKIMEKLKPQIQVQSRNSLF